MRTNQFTLNGIQALTDYETRYGRTPPVSSPDSDEPEVKSKKKKRGADGSGEPLPEGLLFRKNPEERGFSPRDGSGPDGLDYTSIRHIRSGDI